LVIGSHIRLKFPLIPATVLFLLAIAVAGCDGGREPSLEKRALSIDKSLMCPVCPGETIDQSQVQLAGQMRTLVRERLAEGWSSQQIRDFFVDSYGEDVLAEPPKSGFNLIAWLVPLFVIVAALLLLAMVIVAMRRTASEQPGPGGPVAQELEPYLSMVDSELGLPGDTSSEPEDDRG
jgi:cytochrome c-type biogenesis protein CcmH